MTREDRIVAVLEAIGLDMKVALAQAPAGSRHLPVRLAAGTVVRVPVGLTGGVQVGLAAGGHVQIYVGA